MLAPTNAQAYNNRAIAYSLKGYLDRAMADFDQAITHDPTHAELYYNRGRFYFKKGDVDSAISDFDQAIKIDPKFVDAYTRRGLRYSDKGDFDHAIADFSQAIAIARRMPMPIVTGAGQGWFLAASCKKRCQIPANCLAFAQTMPIRSTAAAFCS